MSPDNTRKDEVKEVKNEYDFSNAQKNPYANKVKQQITISLNFAFHGRVLSNI